MAPLEGVPLFVTILLSVAITAKAVSDSLLDTRGVPSDVPYIRCETCKYVVQAAVNQTNELTSDKLSEIHLFDLVESLCDPTSSNGKWVRTIDMVERVRKVHLVSHPMEQECKQECRTVALACNSVLDGVETELAERLYLLRKKGSVDETDVIDWLCDKAGVSTACVQRVPFYPKERPTGPPFQPMDDKDADVQDMIKKLNSEAGGGVNVMSGADLKSKIGANDNYDDDEDDNDDEEDDEDSISSDNHESSIKADSDYNEEFPEAATFKEDSKSKIANDEL